MNIHNLINQAITNKGTVQISYRDFNGNVTNRDISPLEWADNTDKFLAYCHLRNGERHFRVANVLSCELVSLTSTSLPTSISLQEQSQILESASPYMEIQPVLQSARKRKKNPRTEKIATPTFSKVKTADHWSRLVQYFRKCLIHENYQQYIIENQSGNRLFWSVEEEKVHQFMGGVVQFEFTVSPSRQQPAVVDFIRAGTRQKNQQLCFGYPIYVVGSNKVAPLIFSPLTIEEINSKINLQAEDYEVSYAVFKSLQLDDEEIELILAECAKVQPQAGQSIIQALIDFLVGKLSEITAHPFTTQSWDGKKSASFQKGQIYTAPCLFWVSSNRATGNLIEELGQLSNEMKWSGSPSALKEIFSSCPEHEYPEVPPLENDKNIYVTAINEQQRRAIKAIQNGVVSVITGPPGTGKSQMVLNMVAQAILNDQTVLFASRNNKAVDVVMGRLSEELHFPGAVRTGNTEARRQAANTMESALNLITTAGVAKPASDLRKQYFKQKETIKEAEKLLDRIRELRGLIESHQVEREALVKRLHPKLVQVIQSNAPRYHPHEVEHFLAMISTLTTTTLKMKHRKSEFETSAINAIKQSGKDLVEILEQFEDQWGSFGGGFLHPNQFDSLEDLQTYIQLWLALLPASGIQSQITQLNQVYRELHQYRLRSLETLPLSLQGHVKVVALIFTVDHLDAFLYRVKRLTKYAKAVLQNQIPFLEKVLIWLGLKQPSKQIYSELVEMRQSLDLMSPDESTQKTPSLTQLADECAEIVLFLEMCLLQRRINDNRQTHNIEEEKLNEASIDLPEAIREDIRKLDIPAINLDILRHDLTAVLNDIQALMSYRDQLTERVNVKIDNNEDGLKMLAEFKGTSAGNDKRLWSLRIPATLLVIEKHLTKWRSLVSLWAVNSRLQSLEQEGNNLPKEDKLLDQLSRLEKEQLEIGAQIIKRQWLGKVRALDNDTIRGVHHYVSAVKQLSEKFDSEKYRDLKITEAANLANAIKVFPVWATTNLAAKSNLSLTPELFDIVIIDEASQCDIPSALPLLYRAKQIVIIGDPNQLKHVATLSHETDQETAAQFGIDTSAFHYNSHSLFDIAARSVGVRPGKLTLREHFRSHSQIIGFSNEEFYNGDLIVKTDLERQGIPEKYLKTVGGVFWLHVDGVAERPANGSAVNLRELDAVKNLLPRFNQLLRHYDIPNADLGIVTPYREQARRFEQSIDTNDQILVGTAHTFQGNERDIMIFSPVLAPGLPEGSLNWLDQTANLLNVAITRARSTLIIVGNWDFCRTLPPSSKYRRLTDYIARQTHQPFQTIDDLFLFNGAPFDVIGTLLDPAQPRYNRITLRRLISSCHEFVWWMDPYFNSHVFDLLLDIFQDADTNIKSFRLLTSTQQVEPSERGNTELDLEKAKTLTQELKLRGINFELRLLPKKKLPHDRLFYCQGQSINMPPFAGAYGDHKHISEYTRSETDVAFFEQFWEQASVL